MKEKHKKLIDFMTYFSAIAYIIIHLIMICLAISGLIIIWWVIFSGKLI